LYKKAAAGELPNLTGVGQDYEAPETAELVLDGTAKVEANLELMLETFFN
jgi:bifunctional enzyme CysN/CysC